MKFKSKDLIYYLVAIIIVMGYVAVIFLIVLGLVFIVSSLWKSGVNADMGDLTLYFGLIGGGGALFAAINQRIKALGNQKIKKKFGL